jgi:hypothetical protein
VKLVNQSRSAAKIATLACLVLGWAVTGVASAGGGKRQATPDKETTFQLTLISDGTLGDDERVWFKRFTLAASDGNTVDLTSIPFPSTERAANRFELSIKEAKTVRWRKPESYSNGGSGESALVVSEMRDERRSPSTVAIYKLFWVWDRYYWDISGEHLEDVTALKQKVDEYGPNVVWKWLPKRSGWQRQDVTEATSYSDPDAYAVYAALMKSDKSPKLVVGALTEAKPGANRQYFGFKPPRQIDKVWRTAIADFIEKYQKPQTLQRAIPLTTPFEFLTEGGSDQFLASVESKERFRRRFPLAQGVYTFSSVGFDRERTHAVVDMNYFCIEGQCGYGGTYLLEKRKGVWCEVEVDAGQGYWAA